MFGIRKPKPSAVAGGIIGFVSGDAAGVPFEFKTREGIKESKTVPDLIYKGYGSHFQPAGTWSDDSSMTLCLMQSIIDKDGEVDLEDIMDKFIDWVFHANYTASGRVFDIGQTCSFAIQARNLGLPISMCAKSDEKYNGNGGLMRVLPLAYLPVSDEKLRQYTYDVSGLTHGHIVSKICSAVYVMVARELIKGERDKFKAVIRGYERGIAANPQEADAALSREFPKIYLPVPDKIHADSYVVHSLTAALWAFLHANSYMNCIVKAIELGDDTDTTAAIAGGLAGIYYGYSGIPKTLVDGLARKEYLLDMIKDFEKTIQKT